MFDRLASALLRVVPGRWATAIFKSTAVFIRKSSHRSKAFQEFARNGLWLLPMDYYSPVPPTHELEKFYWGRQTEMVGVEINEAIPLDLLTNVLPRYLAEFREQFPDNDKAISPFYLINEFFMAVDAHVYYGFVRHFKPNRIIEIGAGFSTLVAAAATVKNRLKHNHEGNLTAIEPWPSTVLKQGFHGLAELIEKSIQEVDMDLFTSLNAGDFLFIDSSHVLRAGGDVEMEYCEILPRLKPGVFVHVHDIYLPERYPRIWFEAHRHFWNEQSLLQAFLCNNPRFEVIWPASYMMSYFRELMFGAFPEIEVMHRTYPWVQPSSFWMRVK